MKNQNLIFNTLITIAVAGLYVLHFTSDKKAEVAGPSLITSDGKGPVTVYVNGDSLLNNYEYFKDVKKLYEAKTERIQKELTSRRSALEKEIGMYQQSGGNMTPEQRAKVEEMLMRKQQELQSFSEKQSIALSEEESKLNETLFNKVSDYLKEFSKDKSYKIVLNYTKGTGILFANDSLDITDEVLEGLNKEHIDSKK